MQNNARPASYKFTRVMEHNLEVIETADLGGERGASSKVPVWQ
jgi:hypothetical protein